MIAQNAPVIWPKHPITIIMIGGTPASIITIDVVALMVLTEHWLNVSA